jgi:hypothetical protein
MTRRFALAGALAAALLPQVAAMAQSAPVLAGSVYRGGSGGTSTALVGALVYVHGGKVDDGSWTGPVVTDAYGRFAFFGDFAPGRYVLRVFVARKRVWEQVVTIPGRLPPIVAPASE